MNTSKKMKDVITRLYRDVCKIPTFVSAKIVAGTDRQETDRQETDQQDVTIMVTYSISDLVKMKKNIYQSTVTLCNGHVQHSLPVQQNEDVILTAYNKGKVAQLCKKSKTEEKYYLGIIGLGGEVNIIDLNSDDHHGKVYTDVEFSAFVWSPDGTKLAYIAEKKDKAAKNFFAKLKEDDEDTRGLEHLYKDDWGEQLVGNHQSVVVVVDLESEALKVFEMEEENCPTQIVWTPDSEGLVGVALVPLPFRLGLIYCRNRKSFIFHLKLDEGFSALTTPDHYYQSPRFSPDGSKIAYQQSPVGGPHIYGAQLMVSTWPDYQTKCAYGLQKENDEFKYGLYGDLRLVENPWLDDDNILVSTLHHMSYKILTINTSTGTCSVREDGLLLDKSPNWIVYSSPVEDEFFLSFKSLGNPLGVFKPKILPNQHHLRSSMSLSESSIKNSTLLYLPKTENTKCPLIVCPHGGPHSASSEKLTQQTSFLVEAGFAVLLINYPGSLGYGTDYIDELPGHCGDKDIEYCHKMTLEILKCEDKRLDGTSVCLFGGSHGGFIVTHLAARYPDLYKVVSTRNPVTDLTAMASVTDIPDWTFVEAGLDYHHKTIGYPETKNILSMSPIHHIDNVKAPVLMLVGRKDRRVPPSQGITYYKKLVARGIPTKLLVYDDDHRLGKVDVEADSLINTVLWFKEHLAR